MHVASDFTKSAALQQFIAVDWQQWKNPANYDPALPLIKRGLERWVNDFGFRKEFSEDPLQALKNHNLNLDARSLQILTDPTLAKTYSCDDPLTPELVKQYRQFIRTKKRHCIEIRSNHPVHLKWQRWRQRMVNATLWRDGPQKHAKLVHAPFTVELTKGCTVGCWFCGVDAEKYQGPVELNNTTQLIWKNLLTAFRSICGQESAQHGFCYWATDPFDHPEYEWFMEEFHTILGYWPQTTTAQVLKHIDRMRKLLNHIKDRNAFVQRFSMIRSTDLDNIHDAFSPEELFLCELIPQYDDRLSPKATAGRVRKLVMDRQNSNKNIQIHYNLEHTGSIACVSGFLINLVQQSLKIITPCNASDRWPLGYRVLAEQRFEDPENIEGVILDMLDKTLNDRLLMADPIVAYPHIKFTASDSSTICAHKYGYSFSLPNIMHAEHFAELLESRSMSVAEICRERGRVGSDIVYTSIALNQMFDQGLFDEEIIDSARK